MQYPLQNVLHSAYHVIFFEHDLYSMRMCAAVGQNSFDMTARQPACALVCLEDYIDKHASFYRTSVIAIHIVT